MPRPRKIVTLNFAAIEGSLNRGETLKLKVLAAEYGTCPPVIKRYLSEYFGDKIEFVPGRNGGVRAATTPTVNNTNTPELTAVA
jgi:hypothetical protein